MAAPPGERELCLHPAGRPHGDADRLGRRLDGHDGGRRHPGRGVHDALPSGTGSSAAATSSARSLQRPRPTTVDARAAGAQPATSGTTSVTSSALSPKAGSGQVTPLDEGHRVLLDQLRQGEVRHLRHRAGAVDVGVDEARDRAARPAAVVAHQREGRAGHRARHAERGGEALGEDGLAGAEVAHQEHDVAGAAEAGQATGQLPGGLGRVGGRRDGPARGAHVRPAAMRRLARTRSARISAMASPPARST